MISESFKYKSSITGKTSNANLEKGQNTEEENRKIKENLEIVVSLKYLNNFWRSLNKPLINCNISLTLTWSKNCILTDITTQTARAAQGGNPARERIQAPTNAKLKIADTKLYVPVVTLSTKDDNSFLEQLKSGFKRTINWNKYRSEMTNETKTNHLNHLIDPTFTKVNRIFVLLFENEEDRISFYVTKFKIKDYNMLIDGKSFFDVLVREKRRSIRKNYGN